MNSHAKELEDIRNLINLIMTNIPSCVGIHLSIVFDVPEKNLVRCETFLASKNQEWKSTVIEAVKKSNEFIDISTVEHIGQA